jgi:hypothetical protein
MSWEKPDWYLTPQEFADLVIDSLEATNHFKRDELAHPEDLVIAFTIQAEAIAIGAGAAGRKVSAAKKAIMTPTDLKKNVDSEDSYSEHKWRNVTLR